MHFAITKARSTRALSLGENVKGIQMVTCDVWRWTYREGTPENPGDGLYRSIGDFYSEADARSDIAAVRKKAGGVRYAKVVIK